MTGKLAFGLPYLFFMACWLLIRKLQKKPPPTQKEGFVFTALYSVGAVFAYRIYFDGLDVLSNGLELVVTCFLITVVALYLSSKIFAD